MDEHFNVSLRNTNKLKELILDNPELPLVIFCGEECNNGEYAYQMADAKEACIEEVTLHTDNYYLTREELTETLSDELCDEYPELDDEQYQKMIAERVENTKFEKMIVIYVG